MSFLPSFYFPWVGISCYVGSSVSKGLIGFGTFVLWARWTGNSDDYALGNVDNGTILFMYGLTLRFFYL